MRIIALTGGIACGKTTISGMLEKLGARIVDADGISRSLTAPGGKGLPAVREAFGDGVFAPDGTLDRAALAKVIFSDEAQREKLNAILHPMVHAEMESQIEACRRDGTKVVILDVPLLFEAGMQHMGDEIACACAPEEVQIQRLASRNGYGREEALGRIRSQWPLEEKKRLSDIVIDTNLPLCDLEREVCALYDRWANS